MPSGRPAVLHAGDGRLWVAVPEKEVLWRIQPSGQPAASTRILERLPTGDVLPA
jgi:hypothetical protein